MENDFELFACTIKKNVKTSEVHTVQPSTYEEILTLLRSRGAEFNQIMFEYDKKDLCHLHCFCILKKYTYRKKLLEDISPYHVKLVHVYNAKGWQKYINKEQSIFKRSDEGARGTRAPEAGVSLPEPVTPNLSPDTPIDPDCCLPIYKKSMFKK